MQHRRLSNDNSVQDSLSGVGIVREEKTTEDAKQAEAAVFGGILKNDDVVVGNGVKVSKISTIPRIVMKDAFVLPSRSMYGTAVEVRCGKLREGRHWSGNGWPVFRLSECVRVLYWLEGERGGCFDVFWLGIDFSKMVLKELMKERKY